MRRIQTKMTTLLHPDVAFSKQAEKSIIRDYKGDDVIIDLSDDS